MILICYDGSEDAREAIKQAGTLMPGYPAAVLTVGEPEVAQSAEDLAHEGAQMAHSMGIDARPATRPLADTVARTILSEADRLDCHAVIIGRAGRPGQGDRLGSVSQEVLRGARCPVLVIRCRIPDS
jgi:nucleotide-binding universal stress UspA family protein